MLSHIIEKVLTRRILQAYLFHSQTTVIFKVTFDAHVREWTEASFCQKNNIIVTFYP